MTSECTKAKLLVKNVKVATASSAHVKVVEKRLFQHFHISINCIKFPPPVQPVLNKTQKSSNKIYFMIQSKSLTVE